MKQESQTTLRDKIPRQNMLYCFDVANIKQLFFATSKDCSPLGTVASCSAHPDGLFNPLYFESTKSSIDHKLLTALGYILMLVLISPVKTRPYACYISRWSTGISSDQSETLQILARTSHKDGCEGDQLWMCADTFFISYFNLFFTISFIIIE